MVFLPGQESPPARRLRRRIIAIAVGLSLALHAVGVVVFLVVGVKPVAGPPGAGAPGEYVVVIGGEEELAAAGDLPPTGPPAAAGEPSGGNTTPAPTGDLPVGPRQDSPSGARGAGTSAAPGGEPTAEAPARSRPRRRVTGARAEGGGAPASPGDAGAPPTGQPAGGEAKVDPTAAAERAAFRAELRRRIKQGWRPAEVYRRVDPANRLQGSLFTTRVTLRLRADGSIVGSRLAASSGVPALDKEAMEAMARTRPPAVPKAMVDDEGGLTVDCELSLDVGMFAFAAKIRAVVAELWRPSVAFSRTSEEERITLVRLMLSREGKLLETQLVQTAGIDFLDKAAREAVPLGTNLPVPPPAFTRQPGPAQVLIAFRHKQGVVGILMPREEMTED